MMAENQHRIPHLQTKEEIKEYNYKICTIPSTPKI
jgi:hypothetical protein